MQPRIEAERALERINEAAIAAGNLKPEAQREYLGELDKRARGSRKRLQPSLEQLQGMGVPVELEPVVPDAGEEVSP